MPTLFGVDLRSLALFRVALAFFVLLDLASRCRDLAAHYTDAGILPRADLLQWYAPLQERAISLFLAGGALWTQTLLFLTTAACAAALLVGFRTRLAAVATWLMVMSLQLRDPLVLFSGDTLLRLLLFWGMLLPLGARYSVDLVISPSSPGDRRKVVVSVATAALLLQVLIAQLGSLAAMWGEAVWRSGGGVAYALDHEMLATAAGVFLHQFPGVDTVLTRIVLILQVCGPVLLFAPLYTGPIRTVVVLALSCVCIGASLCLRLGEYPWLAIVGLLSFLPSWFWDAASGWYRTSERFGLTIQVNGRCSFCYRAALLFRTFFLLPQGAAISVQPEEAAGTARHRWTVIDHRGNLARDYDGFLMLCRASPLLSSFTPMFRLGAIRALATAAWRRIPTWRHSDSGALPSPGGRRRRSSWAAEVVALGAAFFVLVWNIGTWRDPGFRPPSWIDAFGDVLDLKQTWGLPTSAAATGWIAIPGTLQDGTAVNLFAAGGPAPDLEEALRGDGAAERPSLPSHAFASFRWMAYFTGVAAHPQEEQPLLYYGRYLCREWNSRYSENRQLQSFDIVFMSRAATAVPSLHPEDQYQRTVLWQHWCFR